MGNLKKADKIHRTTLKIITLLILTTIASACSRITPAGFWENFHKDLISTKGSDQGPWGGNRGLHWKSNTTHTFTDHGLIEFAEQNDWILVDSTSFSVDTLNKASFRKLKNDAYSVDILEESVVPKLTATDSKLFVFKTTWMAVEPGNLGQTFENGFAVLNSDGTELKVFHLWGE
jgi:hypothetical protein